MFFLVKTSFKLSTETTNAYKETFEATQAYGHESEIDEVICFMFLRPCY